MKNYLLDILKDNSIEIGEEFLFGETNKGFITSDGELVKRVGKGVIHYSDSIVAGLLLGCLTIRKIPWTPRYGEYFWSVDFISELNKKGVILVKHGRNIFIQAQICLGNCFKTEEEALKNANIMRKLMGVDEECNQ